MSGQPPIRLTFAVTTHDWYDTFEYGWWEDDPPVETKRRIFPGDTVEVQLWFELGPYRRHRSARDATRSLSPRDSSPIRYRYVGEVEELHKWGNVDSRTEALGIGEHWEFLIDCGLPLVVDGYRRAGDPDRPMPERRSIIEGEADLQANLCLWDGYFHAPARGRLMDVVPAEFRDGNPVIHHMTLEMVGGGVPVQRPSWSNPDERVFDTGGPMQIRCRYCGGRSVTRAWAGETRRKKGAFCHGCLRWFRTLR